MSHRALLLLWAAMAFGVWNAIYDPYIERGVRASLQLVAEAQLGLRDEPAIHDVMAGTSRHGARVATAWALVVFALGWLTVSGSRLPRGSGDSRRS